jgi:hypothetical protein
MFFVAKDKIGTTLGSQKEYAACTRRGVGFTSHGNVWHYFWPAEMIEPSIRARFEQNVRVPQPIPNDDDELTDALRPSNDNEPTHYLWSQTVAPGEVIGEPVINPYSGEGDWTAEAKSKYLEALRARGEQ